MPNEVSYSGELGKQWIKWVESPESQTNRERATYPRIREWLNDCQPSNLVDIGCGEGIVATLVNDSVDYIGVDPSPDMLARAQELHAAQHRKFKRGSAYNLPLDNSSADAAMSIWVWSHLENLPAAAAEMARILRTGGHYLIITASPETYEARKSFYKQYTIRDNILYGDFDLGEFGLLPNSTLVLHTKDTMLNALRAAGFTVDKAEGFDRTNLDPRGLYVAISGFKKASNTFK